MTATAKVQQELSVEEIRLLKLIHAKLGNRAKRLIRDAWEFGIYSHELVYRENDEQMMQSLRNRLGPRWLNNLKWKDLG